MVTGRHLDCGVRDILIAMVDGLKEFTEPINAACPQTLVQTCIVHLLRNALAHVSWQDRKQVVGHWSRSTRRPRLTRHCWRWVRSWRH